MDKAVLDTSTIIKSIFKPSKSLSSTNYKKELETHEKCRRIIRLLEEKEVDVYIPKVCVVETAAVVKRLADKNLAMKISKSVFDSYDVVDEAILLEPAWAIAIDTGCSGFDSYFIALAEIKEAMLLTDDGGMHFYAKESDIDTILIRDIDFKRIENILE